jgi:hypothetical protein
MRWSTVRNKSGRKKRDRILGLIPAQRAELFLCDLANLVPANQTREWVLSWAKRYSDMFSKLSNDPSFVLDVIALRDLLRRAWDSRDQRRRDWWLHEAEAFYHKQREGLDVRERLGGDLAKAMLGEEYLDPGGVLYALRIPDPPETVTPLEAALFHFRQRADKARHCPNPACPNPYFLLARKGQKFCSPNCATPSRKASKLRWWHVNQERLKVKR